ncbi:hypothetical protein [Mesorhizobium sp.]|uniref:hypothetical protein n=1 Tax=Mesorhizobium sp. TaxID=1871066 RepID=UPI0025F028DA|nr:hypothetical protein [Mesorhizobium sp.]
MARTGRISPPAFRRLSPERFTVSPFHGNGEPLYLFVLPQFLELLWRPVTAWPGAQVPQWLNLWRRQGGNDQLPVIRSGAARGLCNASFSSGGDRYLACAAAALAADKAVHDREHGFSLTYPEESTSETAFDNTIRLKLKSGEKGLTCRVSQNAYDPTAPGNPPDVRAFMEKDWQMSNLADQLSGADRRYGFPLCR